jgi:Family of unknown function (DUF5519)
MFGNIPAQPVNTTQHITSTNARPSNRLSGGTTGSEATMPVSGAAEKIAAAMATLPGVSSAPHRFGGTEYCLARREIGHVHGNALVDIPFTKKIREELVSAGKAERHHILPESGWVSIHLRQAADVDRAIELLHRSFTLAQKPKAEAAHTAL